MNYDKLKQFAFKLNVCFILGGPDYFGNYLCFRFIFFLESAFLPVFPAICGILELEAAISTIFATFRSWNLSFSVDLATFSWNLQHFGARTGHATL